MLSVSPSFRPLGLVCSPLCCCVVCWACGFVAVCWAGHHLTHVDPTSFCCSGCAILWSPTPREQLCCWGVDVFHLREKQGARLCAFFWHIICVLAWLLCVVRLRQERAAVAAPPVLSCSSSSRVTRACAGLMRVQSESIIWACLKSKSFSHNNDRSQHKQTTTTTTNKYTERAMQNLMSSRLECQRN